MKPKIEPIVQSLKGFGGEIISRSTGRLLRHPHSPLGGSRATGLVDFVTDDPDHFCKECKTAICRKCGTEQPVRELQLGKDLSSEQRSDINEQVMKGISPEDKSRVELLGREPVEFTDWYRTCKNKTLCDSHSHSRNITEHQVRNPGERFSAKTKSVEDNKHVYYDSTSGNVSDYPKTKECARCGIDLPKGINPTHPDYGESPICRDCKDVLTTDLDRECKCGCGELVTSPNKNVKYVSGHNPSGRWSKVSHTFNSHYNTVKVLTEESNV